MVISRHDVADRLTAFLQDRLSVDDLTDWAERALIEQDFDTPATRDAVARLGLADHRAFGLTWQDCRNLLHDLGYHAQVKVVA
jgi:cobyrinic acid a,c-diamide synthase